MNVTHPVDPTSSEAALWKLRSLALTEVDLYRIHVDFKCMDWNQRKAVVGGSETVQGQWYRRECRTKKDLGQEEESDVDVYVCSKSVNF